ncbi:hypothetical protein EJ04DRAFT_90907 [Polyplosphaeria fusca]|uniref:G domain-containing protein n=1 Tax=Polyplosphaeria fusca TaxID=682080 RepID=A0A9P4QPS7_9PLEO|nr:hypothetical protein EJ04DRAFT_90907 [Polyplosphaeria fusca]
MGLTGSGKSTFISHLTDEHVEIGHSLQSCTTDVYAHVFERSNGQRVYLIDTPGFDDTHKSNAKLLEKVAGLLCTLYTTRCISLVGLVYVQRISDTRVAGSSLRSIRIFEKLCGKNHFKNVVVLTTMWEVLETAGEEAYRTGMERAKALRDTPEFFGNLVHRGAKIIASGNNFESSLGVIEYLADQETNVVTDLQIEMVDMKKTLAKTSVGEYVLGSFNETREQYEKKLVALEEALVEAIQDNDDDLITTISDQKKEYQERMRQAHLEEEDLSVTYEEMMLEQTRMLEERHKQEIELEEKTLRISELEELLERTEKEHTRDLIRLRKEKKGHQAELDEQAKTFEANQKQLKERINREKGKDWAKVKEVRKNALGFVAVLRRALMPDEKDAISVRRDDAPPSSPRRRQRSRSRPSKRLSQRQQKPRKDKDRPQTYHEGARSKDAGYGSSGTDDPRADPQRRASTFETYQSNSSTMMARAPTGPPYDPMMPRAPSGPSYEIVHRAPSAPSYVVVNQAQGPLRRPPPGPDYPHLPRSYSES